jgi:hypothetical protein
MNKIKQDKQQIKDRILRIPSIAQEAINKRKFTLGKCFPVEFLRKGRSLEDIENWKLVDVHLFYTAG